MNDQEPPVETVDAMEVAVEPRERAALVVQPSADVGLTKDPDELLDDAGKAAKALMGVMTKQDDKVMMGGKQYLEYNHWQTVGHFYGVTARIVRTQFVHLALGDEVITGWEATADALAPDGRVLSSADAMCMTDEEKWGARPKYAWCYLLKGMPAEQDSSYVEEDPGPDKITWPETRPADGSKNRPIKKRMLIGTEKVPTFQLRSMAQTRACAKALRNVLGWVAVMAGYSATPAEELSASQRESPGRIGPESGPTRPASAPAARATSPTEIAGYELTETSGVLLDVETGAQFTLPAGASLITKLLIAGGKRPNRITFTKFKDASSVELVSIETTVWPWKKEGDYDWTKVCQPLHENRTPVKVTTKKAENGQYVNWLLTSVAPWSGTESMTSTSELAGATKLPPVEKVAQPTADEVFGGSPVERFPDGAPKVLEDDIPF